MGTDPTVRQTTFHGRLRAGTNFAGNSVKSVAWSGGESLPADPLAWTCPYPLTPLSSGFVDRATLYMGPGGRMNGLPMN